MASIVAEVALRTPFRIVALPPLLRMQLAAEAAGRRRRAKLAKSLFSLFHRRLGRPAWGRMRIARGDGRAVDVRIDAANTHYAALLRAGAAGYEPETSALLDRIVPDGGVFFDVGANWGPFSLLIASRPGFTGRIVAFEPIARVRADLAAVAAQAGFAGIACRGEALSDREGRGAMRYRLHSALATLDLGGDAGVPVAPLDSLDLPPPDAIKIDVEGHEAAVLEGARRTVNGHRPMVVLETWHRPDQPESLAALAWLEREGYRLFRPSLAVAAPGRARLVLAPFGAADRLALDGDFNALACHESRIEALRARL
jgi:FkbM family methyltransferase